MGKNVIVACDFDSQAKLISFLDKMEGADPNFYCKVGMELFDTGALNGFNPVEIIKERGHKVFLDLKLKDIPNTVKKTAIALMAAGADMINVHSDGGYKMMKEVVDEINKIYDAYQEEYDKVRNSTDRSLIPRMNQLRALIEAKPILLGVTVLTSMSEDELRNEVGVNKTPMEQVVSLARITKEAGFDGVVCSPQEIMAVKEACGDDFITVTPGIRFADSKKDDQTRIATPATANIMGSDYIVVGRPITQAEDPVAAYEKCKHDFTEEVKDKKEIKNAKEYIKSLKAKTTSASDVVAQELLNAGAFIINTEDPYLLKSGVAAPIYMDNRILYQYPREQKIIMDYLADLIRTYYPTAKAIYGTPMSAMAFGALVAERLGLKFGFVRKETKDHGTSNKIEGPKGQGLEIVQIEDLITSGESSLEFIKPLQEAGMDVLGIAAIVDNDFVKSTKLIEAGIPYHTLTTGTKIASYASKSGIISADDLKKVIHYKNDPHDETWMSKEASERIAAKRLARTQKQ